MSRGSAKPPEEAKVDLTPMLDVVFILLIFFIVTSNFIQEDVLGFEPPPPPPPKDVLIEPKPTILVVIDADDKLSHVQYVSEVTEHPDYDAALAAVR